MNFFKKTSSSNRLENQGEQKRRRRIWQKIFSVMLCVAMISTNMMSVSATETDTRKADPSTLTNWEDFFGPNVENTDSAGRIWADKTVSTDTVEVRNNVKVSLSGTDEEKAKKFLVGLSAISSSKSIVGQETIPLDVIFVLDTSSSMGTGFGGSNSLGALVTAVNSSIDKLLKLNPNNRVGIASFNTGAHRILELDRYTATGNFLTSRGNSISIAAGVKKGDGTSVNTQTWNVAAGTYPQAGMFEAWGMFSEVADTVLDDGTERMPIMVVMGDGAPNRASTDYTSVNTAAGGETNRVNTVGANEDMYAFLNQLTGAYVRQQMDSKYVERTPLIYTLGLGLGNLSNDLQRVARTLLDPKYVNIGNQAELSSWWTTYQNATIDQQMSLTEGRKTWNITKTADLADGNYVDQYFAAANAD